MNNTKLHENMRRIAESALSNASCVLESSRCGDNSRVQAMTDIHHLHSTYVSRNDKVLPYWNFDSYETMLRIGQRAYHQYPVLRNLVENLVGYIIGDHVKYTVTFRKGFEGTVSEVMVSRIKKSVAKTIGAGWWHKMQQESVIRFFRDGAYNRRMHSDGGNIAIRFIEQSNIRPPSESKERELAPFGIKFVEGDATTPEMYWVRKYDSKGIASIEPVQATEVQERKFNVDANDPRGIPLGWINLCELVKLYQANDAMVGLASTQAAYAAVRHYESGILNEHILAIARGEKERWEDENDGVPTPGGVVDAKGFQLELLGASVPANAFVEIISQQLRLIGSSVAAPEHIVAMDADTGNRSSLISAEAPFARHVQRRQTEVGDDDISLLWESIKLELNLTEIQLGFLKVAIAINAQFPSVVTRDEDKQIRSEIEKMAAGIQSQEGAINATGGDPDIIKQQIEAETDLADLSMFLPPSIRRAAGVDSPPEADNNNPELNSDTQTGE